MKKITILALHLGFGGAENVIASVSNILSKKYEVEIISTYKLEEKPVFDFDKKIKIKYLMTDLKPNKKELKEAIGSKNIFRILKEGMKSVKVLHLRKKLMIKAIKECDSDIIISTRVLHNYWLGKYGKKDAIKIAQEHNHHNNDEKVIKKTIKSLKNIDYFMPVSKELTDFYADKLKNEKIKCVYIPNSLDYFPPTTSNLSSNKIIAVGRLEKEKGFLDLIDVFKNVHDLDDSITLDIVGDGTEKQKINDKVHEMNLEKNVKLHGFQKKEKLHELYANSSLYVMTSFQESFGLVLIEAESFGIPLIAYDSAQGAKQIIQNGKNGYLISDRNKELMTEKIIELMRNQKLREKIGLCGRQDSEKYKIENVAKKWYDFIEKI